MLINVITVYAVFKIFIGGLIISIFSDKLKESNKGLDKVLNILKGTRYNSRL